MSRQKIIQDTRTSIGSQRTNNEIIAFKFVIMSYKIDKHTRARQLIETFFYNYFILCHYENLFWKKFVT